MRPAPFGRRPFGLVGPPVVLIASLLCACSDDWSLIPQPPTVLASSPEKLLHDLQTIYAHRDVAAFDSLLISDQSGDSARAFRFWFWPSDVAGGRMPDSSWDRASEIAATRWMMTSPTTVGVRLDLTFRASHPVTEPGFEGEREIDSVIVDLEVRDQRPSETQPFVFYVYGLQRFRFRVERVTAQGDSLWRIVSWEDLGDGYAAGSPTSMTSWGRLKWSWYTQSLWGS